MNLNLLEECREAKRIGIAGHVRPDGDCLGACLGLWQYLVKCLPAAETKVFLEKPADIFKARIHENSARIHEKTICLNGAYTNCPVNKRYKDQIHTNLNKCSYHAQCQYPCNI